MILLLIFTTFISTFCSLFPENRQSKKNYERPIVVVIPSYNNKDWYVKNLDSIFMQSYKNFRVVYIDDSSSDKTGDLVEKYIKENGFENRVTLVKNTERKRQLANHYMAVHTYCNDSDIVVNLDGDDWLASKDVLSYINHVYADPRIWITYGQYKAWPPGKTGHAMQVNFRWLRKPPFVASHLRTFYAWLFKKIDKADLVDESGNFFPAAADVSFMLPMLEMAGPQHSKFISKVLYIYNRANTLNLIGIQATIRQLVKCPYCSEMVYIPTHKSSHIIRCHRKRYSRLQNLDRKK